MSKTWRKYPYGKKGYITFIIKCSPLNFICVAEESWQKKIQENKTLLENFSLWKLNFGGCNLKPCFIKAEIFVLSPANVPRYVLIWWLGSLRNGTSGVSPSAASLRLGASAQVCDCLRKLFLWRSGTGMKWPLLQRWLLGSQEQCDCTAVHLTRHLCCAAAVEWPATGHGDMLPVLLYGRPSNLLCLCNWTMQL